MGFRGMIGGLLGLLLLAGGRGVAQNSLVDTARIDQLNEEVFSLAQNDASQALSLGKKALEWAQKAQYERGIAKALVNRGIVFMRRGLYAQAAEDYTQALGIRRLLKDSTGEASILNNLGLVYYSQGKYDEALEFFVQSLERRQALRDTLGMAASYNNMGLLHEKSKNYSRALDYYKMAWAIYRQKGIGAGVTGTLSNIANIYGLVGRFAMAEEVHREVLALRQEENDLTGIAASYTNLGDLARRQGNASKALNWFLQSLKIKRRLADPKGMALTLISIGETHLMMGNLGIGEVYLLEAYEIAQRIGAREEWASAAEKLSAIYQEMGQYEPAYTYLIKAEALRDSIYSTQSLEKLAALESRLEIDRQQNEIALLEKEKNIQQLRLQAQEDENNRQKLLNLLLIGSTGFVIVFVAILSRTSYLQRRANRRLSEQNRQIELQRAQLEEVNSLISQQKELVERKNKEIIDSINYAHRIQSALLPPAERLAPYSQGFFVFYQPRDIVSGDFYWMAELSETQVLVAVGDCMGHGVPGGFMTVLANSLLNELVLDNELTQPGLILSELDKKVHLAMARQHVDADASGSAMDMALVRIDRQHGMLTFAGAKLDLYRIGLDNELYEYRGGKFSVGSEAHELKAFPEIDIPYQVGDGLYLSSDGYPDQFGGPQSKKFMLKHLKALFQQIAPWPIAQQEAEVARRFVDWKGSQAQTDDVVVMGIRL